MAEIKKSGILKPRHIWGIFAAIRISMQKPIGKAQAAFGLYRKTIKHLI